MNYLKRFWAFLKGDTWQSWLVSLILIVIFIRLIFFPALAFITTTPLPLVVVESCSMYHASGFDSWWTSTGEWYEANNIEKSEFRNFQFKNGLNKGDIVFVWGRSTYELGDVIIFKADTTNPIIHRVVVRSPIGTKGDNNLNQLSFERMITKDRILGKAVARVPYLGWVKLIFFELSRERDQRGLCN